MDDVIIRIQKLNVGVKGTTVLDADGNYNVYINECLSYDEQVKTYAHEIEHIEQKHFNSANSCRTCEEQIKYMPVKYINNEKYKGGFYYVQG